LQAAPTIVVTIMENVNELLNMRGVAVELPTAAGRSPP
jgi:hypothetical protein